MNMQRLLDLLTRIVGLVLIFAGVTKLRDPYAFLKAVYDYELLPLYGGIVAAAVVPWLEVVIGMFLVVGIWRQHASSSLLHFYWGLVLPKALQSTMVSRLLVAVLEHKQVSVRNQSQSARPWRPFV